MMLRTLCLVALLLSAVTPALATPSPTTVSYSFSAISDLGPSMSLLPRNTYAPSLQSLSGLYDITPLGYEAANTDILVNSAGKTLLTNKDLSKFGTWTTVDMATTLFKDTTSKTFSYSLGSAPSLPKSYTQDSPGTSHLSIFALTKDVVFSLTNANKKITLEKGTLIIGLDDSAAHYDRDDFVLAARKHSATPIPGPVWLLGSGLLGLLGLRRRFAR